MRGWVLGSTRGGGPHFRPDPAPSGPLSTFWRAIDSARRLDMVRAGGPPHHEPVGDPRPSRSPARRSSSCSWGNPGRPQASLPGSLKPIADPIRSMLPFGSPRREGEHDSNEAKRRRRSVVRLIHPKAGLMPLSIDRGAGGSDRRFGSRGTWTARHRWPSSDRQPRLARCV